MNRYYIKKGLEVLTGDRGQKGQKKAFEILDVFGDQRIEKVRDGVWLAMSFGAAATTIVETKNGIIIVDTGDGEHQAKLIIESFRDETGITKPVKGIIYTHWHYALGAKSYMEYAADDVQIWCDEKLIPNLQKNSLVLGESVSQRGAMHMGYLLPEKGEDAIITAGLGKYYLKPGAKGETLELIPPTHIVSGEAKAEIDGMKVEFYNHPSDVTDNIIVNFPEIKVIHQNNLWPGVFNISTSRGDRYRDPLVLLSGLQRVIDLKPEHVCSTHGKSFNGYENIKENFQIYIDSIKYIYSQTIRGINDGLDADEIVERFEVPQKMLDDYVTAEYYGEYAYHIRGIYAGLLGFPTFDPSRFHKLPRKMEGEKMILAMGGLDAVVNLVKKAYEEEEFLWGIQLCNYIVATKKDEQEYKNLKAQGMRSLGQRATAATSRNQLITYARYLEGKVEISLDKLPIKMLNYDVIFNSPLESSINLLEYRIEGIEAFDTGINLQFNVGVEKSLVYKIDHGVMNAIDEEANLVVELDKKTYCQYIVRDITFEEMINKSKLSDSSKAGKIIKVFK